jgi:hypothetical protein
LRTHTHTHVYILALIHIYAFCNFSNTFPHTNTVFYIYQNTAAEFFFSFSPNFWCVPLFQHFASKVYIHIINFYNFELPFVLFLATGALPANMDCILPNGNSCFFRFARTLIRIWKIAGPLCAIASGVNLFTSSYVVA